MKPILVQGLLSAAAAAVGAGAGIVWGERRLAEELTMRPPLVVVDYAPMTAALGRGADPGALQGSFGRVKEVVGRFEAAGYLVVNRVALEAVPAELVISTPDLAGASVAQPLDAGAPTAGLSAAGPAPDVQPPRDPVAAPSGGPGGPPPRPATMSPEEAAVLLRGLLGGAR